MWIKYASLVLMALLISGCSLFATKPKLNEETDQSIPQALSIAFKQGLQMLEKEQYERAEKHWKITAIQWPQYPGIWTNLALSQWHLGDFEAATESNNKAISVNQDFCPAKKIGALLQKEQGLFLEAIASYEIAAECSPNDPDIPYNMGIIYDLYIQDIGLALTYYTKAQSLLNEENETLAMWITDLQNRQPTRIAGEGE